MFSCLHAAPFGFSSFYPPPKTYQQVDWVRYILPLGVNKWEHGALQWTGITSKNVFLHQVQCSRDQIRSDQIHHDYQDKVVTEIVLFFSLNNSSRHTYIFTWKIHITDAKCVSSMVPLQQHGKVQFGTSNSGEYIRQPNIIIERHLPTLV